MRDAYPSVPPDKQRCSFAQAGEVPGEKARVNCRMTRDPCDVPRGLRHLTRGSRGVLGGWALANFVPEA